jgi:antitoxin (DNA-binding transcriptional repressor) of toxin-antitoxin stability system
MNTIGTRDLKQNPNAVIQRVLETGEEFEITAHGHATGVRLVPTHVGPARWVHGEVLNVDGPGLTPAETDAWRADVDGTFDDEVTDSWDRR